MAEGIIDKWLVEDGAHVMKGEPIFVVATDKVETEIEFRPMAVFAGSVTRE